MTARGITITQGMCSVRDAVLRVICALALFRLARCLMVRRGRFVLLLHGILSTRRSDLRKTCQIGLSVAELDQILFWIKRRFDLLTPEQFLKSDNPGVLITFDDGMANTYANGLSILERHGAPAVFFIATQHVLEPRNWLTATRQWAQTQWPDPKEISDEYARELFNGMTPQQVAACAEHPLISIGSHTVSHPFLTQCDKATLENEIVDSRRQLEEITGKTVDLFAYPTGDYDRRVAKAVRAAGYRVAFAVDSRGVGLPMYEIPRIGLYRAQSHYLDAKLSGLYRRPVPTSQYTTNSL